jgi:hypothetical protein
MTANFVDGHARMHNGSRVHARWWCMIHPTRGRRCRRARLTHRVRRGRRTRWVIRVRTLRRGTTSRRMRGEVWLGLSGVKRSRRRSGRRTSRIESRVTVERLTLALRLLRGVGRRQGGCVRLIIGTLLAGLLALRRLLHVCLLRVHRRLLLVALRRRRVLARLLRRVWSGGLLTTRGQWLAIGAVELRVRGRVLSTPHGMRRDERVSLGADRREHALLREALAVGAASIVRLVEAGAANLRRVRTTRNVIRPHCCLPCASDSIDTRSRCAA